MGKGKGKRRKGPSIADRADRHDLYQRAVQTPEADVEFFSTVFQDLRGRDPRSMREDFCGTAYLSMAWCQAHPENTAVGIDLDGPTLEWGRERNLGSTDASVRERVELHQANVLEVPGPKTDITCALNFSYGVFKTRADLRAYFEAVLRGLNDEGIFITELYGGTEGIADEHIDERDVEGFEYVWEQEKYNPITHETLCHIHFHFKDGSKMRRAFTYDWRLWSIPELRELLDEAGFSRTIVYWEAVDEDGDGSGEFFPTEEEEQQESWLCYIVGVK